MTQPSQSTQEPTQVPPEVSTPVTRQRPEIQGLRAVAVLLVVLYHLWPGRLHGGYIGVDVFFVISGFLITGNLLREVRRRGRVHLADFWARRARRLLPAAYLVLAVTALGILLWVPRLQWQQFYKEIAASGLYVENWSLAHDAVDYLASSNAPSPTQHYWTLSAEEQFYLVWPLLILFGILLTRLLRTPRERTVVVVLGVTVAASLVYSLWMTVHDPSVAYFSTLTRAWEFGAGALLACLLPDRPLRTPGRAAALSGAGLAAIAVCALVFDHDTPMPGTAAIVVVAGAAAVIAAGAPSVRWAPTRVLTSRPATFVGDISYSMYLWHWPLLILLPYVIHRTPGNWARVGILVATVLVSWLTKVLVEDPVRTTRNPVLRRPLVSLAGAGLAAVVLVAVSGSAWWDVEQESRHSAAVAHSLVAKPPPCFGAASMDPKETHCPNPDLADKLVPSATGAAADYPDYPTCDAQMTKRPVRACRFGDVGDTTIPRVLVIGDSHARALMPAMLELAKEHKIRVDLYTSGGCAWGLGRPVIADKSLRDACIGVKTDLQAALQKGARDYDFIVTTAWTNKTHAPLRSPVSAMAAAWRPVAEQGVPIVAVRDNPSAGEAPSSNPNNCLASVSVADANTKCSLARPRAIDRYLDPFGAAVKRTPGAHLVDLTGFYCRGGTCPAVIGGVDVYRDNSHVTVTYMRTMAPYLYRAFVDAGVLRPR